MKEDVCFESGWLLRVDEGVCVLVSCWGMANMTGGDFCKYTDQPPQLTDQSAVPLLHSIRSTTMVDLHDPLA